MQAQVVGDRCDEVQCLVCNQIFPRLTEQRECNSIACPIPLLVRRARFPEDDSQVADALDEFIGSLLEEWYSEVLMIDEDDQEWTGEP